MTGEALPARRLCASCGGPLLLARLRVYCSKTCLCRANNAAKMQWTPDRLCDALRRYVAEFGPLPGSGRYQKQVRGRGDYPTRGLLERRYGSVRAAGQAAGVPLDLHKRDWTEDEIERLHALVGTARSFEHVGRAVGRSSVAARWKASALGLRTSDAQGAFTADQVARWTHYTGHTIVAALQQGILVGHKAGRTWQIRAGSLLLAEGLLFRSLDDLDAEVVQLVRLDAPTLPQGLRARIAAWHAYREPGRMYGWRQGEIRAWWAARRPPKIGEVR